MTTVTHNALEWALTRLRWSAVLPVTLGAVLKVIRTRVPPPPPVAETAKPDAYPPVPIRPTLPPGSDEQPPAVIECTLQTPHARATQSCQIAISMLTGRIDWRQTTPWLLGQEPPEHVFYTQADTLPGIIERKALTIIDAHYRRIERAQNLSRHARGILDALEPQLEPALYQKLARALERVWQDEQALDRRQPTFEEARSVLRKQDQFERTLPGRHSADPSRRLCYWTDQYGANLPIARGERREGFCRVRVYTSIFTGEEAEALYQTYSYRHIDPNDATAPHRVSSPGSIPGSKP